MPLPILGNIIVTPAPSCTNLSHFWTLKSYISGTGIIFKFWNQIELAPREAPSFNSVHLVRENERSAASTAKHIRELRERVKQLTIQLKNAPTSDQAEKPGMFTEKISFASDFLVSKASF